MDDTMTPGICTNYYKAPELFAENNIFYDSTVDIWSLGCTLYEFISKTQLFRARGDLNILHKILSYVPCTQQDLIDLDLVMINPNVCNQDGYYKFPDIVSYDITISEHRSILSLYKKYIKLMLIFNPSNRLTAQEILNEMKIYYEVPIISKSYWIRSKVSEDIKNQRDEYVQYYKTLSVSTITLFKAIKILDMISEALILTDKIARICLYIASKYHDINHISLSFLGYKLDDIFTTETLILSKINYNIYQPSIYELTNQKKIIDIVSIRELIENKTLLDILSLCEPIL